jgi:hypothetical protein
MPPLLVPGRTAQSVQRAPLAPDSVATGRPTRARQGHLPFILWVVLLGSLVACVVDFSFFNFAIKGYVWVITGFVASIVALRRLDKVSFPYLLWAPWVLLIVYYYFAEPYPNALQRTLMMICPIMVGLAVSTLRVDDHLLREFLRRCRQFAVALFVFSLASAGVLFSLSLPSVTGLAPQAISAALLANVFATEYVLGRRSTLSFWLLMVALPFIAMTRTAMVAAAVTLPLTLAPMRLVKRAALMAIVAVAGLAAFLTPRIQAKMFYSGHGEIRDVSLDNPDFRTTGREWVWQEMKNEIRVKAWLGHGANAQEWFLESLLSTLTQPHNDWLRLEFDYGYIGAALFGATLLAQALLAGRLGRGSSGVKKILFLSGASAFTSFALIMFTDNIILYAVYFGNLHFTIMGLAYAAIRNEKRGRAHAQSRYYSPERFLGAATQRPGLAKGRP